MKLSTIPFLYDKFGILSKQALLDGAIQKFVLLSLRAEVLKQEHDSAISGNPRAGCKYDTMRRSYQWPYMANDVCTYVEDAPRVGNFISTQRIKDSYNYFLRKDRWNLLQWTYCDTYQ